jgi:hypothetical protein
MVSNRNEGVKHLFTILRLAGFLSFSSPGVAAGRMGGDEIAVGNIPRIKGEFAAISRATIIRPARRQPRLVLKTEDAFHHQAAARATSQALT